MSEIVFTASIESTAVKSECGRYRYILKRVWDSEKSIGAFLCANPSKADHLLLDETVFKCCNLASQWDWGGLYVLNLYPYYEKDPTKLVNDAETDKTNTTYVTKVLSEVEIIILAAGNEHQQRMKELIDGIPMEKIFCLRKNKGGGFLHPSRIQTDDFRQPVKVLKM